jgi:hypothetical protein
LEEFSNQGQVSILDIPNLILFHVLDTIHICVKVVASSMNLVKRNLYFDLFFSPYQNGERGRSIVLILKRLYFACTNLKD